MRVVALGGIKEVGRNMTMFELDGRLLVVDCGMLLGKTNSPGVDITLPDWSSYADRLDQIDAIVLTHGHEDHICCVSARTSRSSVRGSPSRSSPRSSTSTG